MKQGFFRIVKLPVPVTDDSSPQDTQVSVPNQQGESSITCVVRKGMEGRGYGGAFKAW